VYIRSEFLESNVHNVVMMKLFGRDLVAQFQPDAVEQINFF
jgi:hypothetical protein